MKNNNFDFLRLIFALFVLITHSWALTGLSNDDWLAQISGDKLNFAKIGVDGFFIISGYLIYQSLCRSKSLLDYYYKRLLRLFPALIIILLLTVFVLGPVVYEGGISDYIKNRSTWTYIPNNLTLVHLQYTINGIFTHNPFPGTINGSLWTIPYEFFMYILVSFLFVFTNQYKKMLILAGLLVLVTCRLFFYGRLSQYGYILTGDQLITLGTCFFMGSVLASLNFESSAYHKIIFFTSVIGIFIALWSNYFDNIFLLLFPFAVISAGISATKYINKIGHAIGDLSYGIYIYAFVVQQTLMHFFKLNYLQLMLGALIPTLLFAYLSWHLVEKRALKLKPKRKVSYVV
jgi:peptidoglycan/LPS O-acetylase OafA/YrhL